MDHWRVWFAYNQKSFCSGKSVDAATLATLSSQVSEDEVCGPPPVAKILTWLSAVFRRARFFWLFHQHCSWGQLLFETPVTALNWSAKSAHACFLFINATESVFFDSNSSFLASIREKAKSFSNKLKLHDRDDRLLSFRLSMIGKETTNISNHDCSMNGYAQQKSTIRMTEI